MHINYTNPPTHTNIFMISLHQLLSVKIKKTSSSSAVYYILTLTLLNIYFCVYSFCYFVSERDVSKSHFQNQYNTVSQN